METLQPALKNGRNVWNRINMPEAEFELRLSRIREEMKHSGIDLLLLYGRGFSEYADPCYVSNFIIRLPRSTLAVVPLEGPPVIFFEGFVRGLPSLLPTTCVKELKPANDVAVECAAYLRERKLIPCTVGLGRLERLMPHVQFRYLAEALSGCKLVDGGDIVPKLRRTKSPRECDQVRRAGLVMKKAWAQAGSINFDVLTEQILEGALRREARMEEAEDFRMLIARADDQRLSFRPPENRILEPGRAVVVYAAVAFERYWAEAVRTVVAADSGFSLLPPANREFYRLALKSVRPELTGADVYRDLQSGARRSGVELILEHGFGGGIGLSLDESPAVDESSEERIGEGTCLALRLAVRNKEYGSVMVGNTLIVGAHQAESVTDQESSSEVE